MISISHVYIPQTIGRALLQNASRGVSMDDRGVQSGDRTGRGLSRTT